jgi:hypothetical protein
MQITSTLNRPVMKNTLPAKAEPKTESTTFSSHESTFEKGARTALGIMVPTVGIASAGAAAYYASDFMAFGNSMPALYGVLAGAVVGGAAGLGIGFAGAKAYDTFSGDDQAGKGMMSGFMVFGAAATGAVVGGIGGAFGANPLVTVPAAIGGGVGSLAVMSGIASAGEKLFGK